MADRTRAEEKSHEQSRASELLIRENRALTASLEKANLEKATP